MALEKEKCAVQTQEWYKNAENAIENVHFPPHIRELFEDGAYRYQWVVSLSSYVDVNKGEIPETGVLLLDMKYFCDPGCHETDPTILPMGSIII